MVSKPFSPSLYEADDGAKHQVIAWLEVKGYEAWVNPDDYGIDLLGTRGGKTFGWEVEVKHSWKGNTFPYSAVHFAARKLKFALPNHHFLMLNDERTRFLAVRGEDFTPAKIVKKRTIYTSEEDFVEIPLSLCRFATLDLE